MPNGADDGIVKHLLESQHPASRFVQLLASIRLDKRSGLLEVYFNQGAPNGTIKFTEREKET